MAALPGIPHDSSDESSDFEVLHPTEADDFALSEEAELDVSKPPQRAEGEAESESEASEVESVPLDAAPEASGADDDDDDDDDGGASGEVALCREDGADEEGPPAAEATAVEEAAAKEGAEAEVEKQEEPEPAPEDGTEEEAEERQKEAQEDDNEEAREALPPQQPPQQPQPQPPDPTSVEATARNQELEATVRRLQGAVRLLAALCAVLALVVALASALAAYAWSSRNECIKSRQLTGLAGCSQDNFIRPMGSLPSSLFHSAPAPSRLPLNRMGHSAVLSRASSTVEDKPPQKLQEASVKTDWLIGRLNFTAPLNASLQERRPRAGYELKGLLVQRGRASGNLGRPGLLWEKEIPRASIAPAAVELRAALERKDTQIDHLKRSVASKDTMIQSLRDLAVSLRAALQEQHRAGATFKAASERKDVLIQSLNKTSAFMQVLLEKQYRTGKGCVCSSTKVRSRQLPCAEEARPHVALGASSEQRGVLQFKLVHNNKVLFTFNLTVASLEKKLRERGTFLGRLHRDMLKVALPQKETLLRSLGPAAAGPPSSEQPPRTTTAALLCPPTGVSSRGLCGPPSFEASAGGRPTRAGGIASSINLPAPFIHTPLIEGMLQPQVRREPFVRSASGAWAKLAPVPVGAAQRMKVAPQKMQPGRRVLAWPAPTAPRTKDSTTCDSRFLGKTCANALGECRAGGDESNENLQGCSSARQPAEDSIETRRAASRAEEETTWRLSIARMFRTMTSEMQLSQPREEQPYAELWPLSRAASVNRTSTAPAKAGRASISFPLLARSRMS